MSSNITIPTDLELDNRLWRFAGELWTRPAARDACLDLQAGGWSVTDLLCALWLAAEATSFSGMDDNLVLCWRSQITVRLRQVRKTIPKNNPGTDVAREYVARSELESERVELALAYRALSGLGAESKTAKQFRTEQSSERTAKSLALENLQAAAPEKMMDNNTGRLLETLADELHFAVFGEQASC